MTDNSAYRAASTSQSSGGGAHDQLSAEDRPTPGTGGSGGYDMTDNSAYGAAGTSQSNAGGHDQPHAEEDNRSNTREGGGATVNFDMTSNTVYSSTRFN